MVKMFGREAIFVKHPSIIRASTTEHPRHKTTGKTPKVLGGDGRRIRWATESAGLKVPRVGARKVWKLREGGHVDRNRSKGWRGNRGRS
jgi:hypothetical protein